MGATALHWAYFGGSRAIVDLLLRAGKVLVEAGADLRRRTDDGKTALDLARERPDHSGCVAVAAWLTSAHDESAQARIEQVP